MTPEQRRRQLLSVAGELLTDKGVDRLNIAGLAAAAGVTRPIVYRHFPNRQALIVALLEDFESTLTERFVSHAMSSIPGNITDITRVFVSVACDTIEARGAGAWHLLDARGSDPRVVKVGREIQARLMAPWKGAIGETTLSTEREVDTASRMILAAGRAVLDLWLEGLLTREEAVRDAARGISGILGAFSRDSI